MTIDLHTAFPPDRDGHPETGNTNQLGLHWDMVIDLRTCGHIEIDNERISENGRFLRPEWPGR